MAVKTIPAPAADMTQFWVAVRVQHLVANTSYAANPRFWTWAFDTNEESYVEYSVADTSMGYGREHLGSGAGGGRPATSWVAGQKQTVIFTATAAAIRVSVNGAIFTSTAQSQSPTNIQPTFDLGWRGYSQTNILLADFLWAMTGTGTLADGTDQGKINRYGDQPPADLSTVPGNATQAFSFYPSSVVQQQQPLNIARSFM